MLATRAVPTACHLLPVARVAAVPVEVLVAVSAEALVAAASIAAAADRAPKREVQYRPEELSGAALAEVLMANARIRTPAQYRVPRKDSERASVAQALSCS